MSDEAKVESVLQNLLTITYDNETYKFKIPSIQDRININGIAAKIRKDSDPEGNGIALGYDPSSVLLTDKIATFMHLMKETSAKWVYTPGDSGKPIMNMANWSDDVPILEVIDQFNIELDKFRKGGDQH